MEELIEYCVISELLGKDILNEQGRNRGKIIENIWKGEGIICNLCSTEPATYQLTKNNRILAKFPKNPTMMEFDEIYMEKLVDEYKIYYSL